MGIGCVGSTANRRFCHFFTLLLCLFVSLSLSLSLYLYISLSGCWGQAAGLMGIGCAGSTANRQMGVVGRSLQAVTLQTLL